jgi:hypothetical protein
LKTAFWACIIVSVIAFAVVAVCFAIVLTKPDDAIAEFAVQLQIGACVVFYLAALTGNLLDAIHTLVNALGLMLTVDPKKLNLDHPLYCELNIAVAEGRQPRGCDCPVESPP